MRNNYMKKTLLIISIALIGFIGGVLAQEVEESGVQEPVILAQDVLLELPAPGLKYGDFFHF